MHTSVHAQIALFDPDGALADALNLIHGVAREENRDVSVLDEVLDTAPAFLLEEHVADGERLVHDGDVGLGDGGDGKRDDAMIGGLAIGRGELFET